MTFPLRAGSVVLLLVALLTWLLVRSFAPQDAGLIGMRRALDGLALNESLLRADVLSARAGLLRNYDPLVRDIEGMRAAVARLKASDRSVQGQVQVIDSMVAEEERIVELFKSDNALLQNSLAYFDLLSERVTMPGEDPHLVAAVDSIDGSVAHLSRDASPEAVRLVQRRLDALEAEPGRPEISSDIASLVFRGRLLLELMPRVDEMLRRLLALSTDRGRQAVRSAIQSTELAQEQHAARFRVGLYSVALLLSVLLVLVGFRLRADASALRRRSYLEHLIGLASNRFIACQPEEIPSRIDDVLRMFGEGTRPDRVYVLRCDGSHDAHLWSNEGVETPAGWPGQLVTWTSELAASPEAIFRTPYQERDLPRGLLKALQMAGVSAWSGAKLMRGETMIGLLCFDHIKARPRWLQETAGLLRMQGDVIGNALHREAMSQERRALEARLRQGQRLEAIGTFTSGVAHNFNNVIGTMLGHAEMAADSVPPGSPAIGHVAQIAQAGERARALVGQILDFGRRGRAAQYLTSLDALLAETLAQLRPVMPEIDLVASGSAEGALVMAEPAQLQQVLINLIRNGAQASQAGARISIELERLPIKRLQILSHGTLEPGPYVRLAVVDQGQGMESATLAKIFEPFFTTRAAGTGLGLATALEIIGESGGAFEVRSTPGQGSRFEAWLPEALDHALEPAIRTGIGGTVMLVGADQNDVLGDEERLAALGFEPVGFSDPNAALGALRVSPERFDLVIADKSLRDTSGLDFARAAHQSRPQLPIILCLSAADRIEAEQLTCAGVTDVVRRPWQSGSLVATLVRNVNAAKVD